MNTVLIRACVSVLEPALCIERQQCMDSLTSQCTLVRSSDPIAWHSHQKTNFEFSFGYLLEGWANPTVGLPFPPDLYHSLLWLQIAFNFIPRRLLLTIGGVDSPLPHLQYPQDHYLHGICDFSGVNP